METSRLVGRVRIADLPEETQWPKHELIDGTLIVTPFAGLPHQAAVMRLSAALDRAAPDDVVVYPGANVRRSPDDEANLLIPDVVVARAGAGDGTYLTPSDVLLVVEVVSPGGRRFDAVVKRDTYAEWGVPAYLVVDGAPERFALTWHGDTSGIAWAVEVVEALVR